MGADQSHSGSSAAPLKSQRDEDIPYTSCSISKPISSDAPPKASPRLRSKSSSRDPRESSGKHDIVVVTEGLSSALPVDPETVRLDAIPAFLPLLRSASIAAAAGGAAGLGIGVSSQEWEGLSQLDARRVLGLCLRYQEHLKQCAEVVAVEQNSLCGRIKEVDFAIQSLYGSLTERQKKFSKYAEQIQKVQEMSNTLGRIQVSFEQIVPLMERLNSMLPAEEQLEPFSMAQPPSK